MTTTYEQGNEAEIDAIWSQKKGTVMIDPDLVAAEYTPPGGTLTTVTYTAPAPGQTALQRSSQGHYTLILDTDLLGTYTGRIYSTGIGKASKSFEFTVIAP